MIISSDMFLSRVAYVDEWQTFMLSEDGYRWHSVTDNEITNKIMRLLDVAHPDVSYSESKLVDLTRVFKRKVPLQWKRPKERYIVFTDCLLDLSTLQPVPFPDAPLTNGEIALLSFPFAFPRDTGREMPKHFANFLRTSLVEEETHEPDPTLVVFVQEIMGYLLLPDLFGAAAFFFYGAGKNGKSVLADLCRVMIGNDLSMAMTLETLTTNHFAASALVGKKLNVVNEDESRYLQSDRFKALVTGEFISAERKFGSAFNYRPFAKHIFCTNSQPRFDELNHGLRRRVKILPFYRRIPNSEKDVHLLDKLKEEMPDIVAWALEGARRFIAKGYEFSDEESPAMLRELSEFEDAASPSSRFVKENYVNDDEGFVSNEQLYAAYVEWCKTNGNKPLNSMNFHKDVTKNSGAKSFTKKVGGITLRGKRLRGANEPSQNDIPL